MANPYENYKKQSINTMTDSELLTTLYDELLRCFYKIKKYIINKQDELFIIEINKVNDIIRYLIDTLNFNYKLSNDLYKIYDFILYNIARLSASKNHEILDDVTPLIKDLYHSFDSIKHTK